MKFFEAMQAVAEGKAVRRKDWVNNSGILMGVDKWYVFLHGGTVAVYEGNHVYRAEMKITLENLKTDDWEVCSNMYEIELAALKKKYDRS